MQVREDLSAVAAKLAAAARTAADAAEAERDGDALRREQAFAEAATFASGARDALDAARLVDVPAGALVTALADFAQRVGSEDVQWVLAQHGPEAALDAAAGLIELWRGEVAAAGAYKAAYSRLEELTRGLLRDFESSGAPAARRMAERIRAARDEAQDRINGAKGRTE